MIEVHKAFTFEAAHFLPMVDSDHKCARIHGHSYSVTVSVAGEVHPAIGWVMDFAEISAAWDAVHQLLDHRLLNEIEGLENPTSEVLAGWLWDALEDALPGLAEIDVMETATAGARLRR